MGSVISPSPTNAAVKLLTAPEDWTIDVVNHPTAIAFMGESVCMRKLLIVGSRNFKDFLINSIENTNR